MKRVTWILISLIVLSGTFAAPILAQSKIRTLDHQKYRYKNEPLMVVGRAIGDKPFPNNDNKIEAEPDWLKNLSLDVKNISSKNIAFFEIHLVVDNPRKLLSQDSIALRFTGWPTFKDNTEFVKLGGKRVTLKPGEIVRLSVREQLPPTLMNYVESLTAENFDRVSIDIRYVQFDDGTGWGLGKDSCETNECIVRYEPLYKNSPTVVLKRR